MIRPEICSVSRVAAVDAGKQIHAGLGSSREYTTSRSARPMRRRSPRAHGLVADGEQVLC